MNIYNQAMPGGSGTIRGDPPYRGEDEPEIWTDNADMSSKKEYKNYSRQEEKGCIGNKA